MHDCLLLLRKGYNQRKILTGQDDFPSTRRIKPRFFYGYAIVAVAFVIMVLTFGVNRSFGVFLNPLVADFGWSRAVVSGAYSLTQVAAGVFGIFAGKLGDRFGARVLGITIGLFLGLGLLLMSQVNAIWQVYLIYGLMIAVSVGACWPVLMPLIPRWFITRRGLMTGIVASGSGFGFMVIPSFAGWLILAYDWRTAYMTIGVVALLLVVVAAQYLKRDPGQIGQLPYGEGNVAQEYSASRDEGFNFREAVRTRNFGILCALFLCFGFSAHSVLVHVVPHAIDTGLSAAKAASILAVAGGLNTGSRVAIGWSSDRIGVKRCLVVSLVLLWIGLFWIQFVSTLWEFYIFSFFFGVAFGGVLALMVLVTTELFGLNSLGVILGGVIFMYTVGGATGPIITGYIFDVTGSYQLGFLITALLAVAACVLALLLRPQVKQR
jgi:MFS family permease